MKSTSLFHRSHPGLAAWLAAITIARSQSANVMGLDRVKKRNGQFGTRR